MTRHCTFLSIYLFLLSKQFSYMIPFSFQNKRTSKTTAMIKMMIPMTEGYTIILSQQTGLSTSWNVHFLNLNFSAWYDKWIVQMEKKIKSN